MRRILFILLLSSLVLTGCTLAGDITPPAPLATSQAAKPVVEPTEPPSPSPTSGSEAVLVNSVNPERGTSTYSEKCAPCHGQTGLGDGTQSDDLPVPASPIGDPEFASASTPLEWYEVVTEGRLDRFMPGFASLDDQERWDVVAFALSLASQPMDVLLGGEIFAGLCVDCHGADGSGTGDVPDLTNFEWISQQSVDQIVATIEEGISPGMPPFSDSLVEDERLAVAKYIYNLSFPGTTFHSDDNVTAPDQDELIAAKLSGKIINGTDGGTVPGGIVVTLYGFDGQQASLTESTQASDTGEYFFDDVEIQPGRVFVTAAEYLGATYGSEIVHIADEFELDLPITIYDTSSDLSQIQVDRLHLIFDMPAEGVLQVTELWILSNFGDHTIATEDGEGVFKVQLPQGASNLGFESGTSNTRFQPTAQSDGFVDLLPIRPGMGSHEIVFSFNLTIDDDLDLSQSLGYPVDAVVLLAPQGVVELEGNGIEDLGIRQMSGAALQNYSAGPISANDDLEITVKRIKVSSNGSDNTVGIVVGVGFLIVALASTGFWLDRRMQKREVGSVEAPRVSEPAKVVVERGRDREKLLQQLADLDDAFGAGEIQDEEYQIKRMALKDQLMDVLE